MASTVHRSDLKKETGALIPALRGGRYGIKLAPGHTTSNEKRGYVAALRHTRMEARKSTTAHPQVPNSHFIRLTLTKERWLLYRVPRDDLIHCFSTAQMAAEPDDIKIFSYWQPNPAAEAMFNRIRQYTSTMMNHENQFSRIWDLNMMMTVMHQLEARKIGDFLGTNKGLSFSQSGLPLPRAYAGALQNAARTGPILMPLELHAAFDTIIKHRAALLSQIERELSEDATLHDEYKRRIDKFSETNREWVEGLEDTKRDPFGEELPLPLHEYQLKDYLPIQKPLSEDALMNECSIIPGWAAYGVRVVRARRDLVIGFDERRPVVEGNGRPLRIRPSSLGTQPPSMAMASLPSTEGPPLLHFERPPSIASSMGSEGYTRTVSTATTTPHEFMYDWGTTGSREDMEQRYVEGPPKGCETDVNLEWRMRLSAERLRRLRELNGTGFVDGTSVQFSSTSPYGSAIFDSQRRDNQYRRRRPLRPLPPANAVLQAQKECQIRDRYRELQSGEQTRESADEMAVLLYALEQIRRRREAWTGTEKEESQPGLRLPGTATIGHSSPHEPRDEMAKEEIMARVGGTLALRQAIDSDAIEREQLQRMALVMDVSRNTPTLRTPYRPRVGYVPPRRRRDVLAEESVLASTIYFVVFIVAFFFILYMAF